MPAIVPDAKPRGRPAVAVGRVLVVVREHPGLTGVEIYRHLEANDTPVAERTVRTCLRRLRNKSVRQRDGKWYPIVPGAPLGSETTREAPGTPPH